MALRIADLGQASLRSGEVLTSLRATVPLEHALDYIAMPGNHVPLYFLSVRLLPTDNELGLRLSSVLVAVIGIALFITTARVLFDDRTALIAGAILAFNPYHAGLSRIARPYPMLFFFSLLGTYLFFQILNGKSSSKYKLWLSFTLSSMAAFLTHYAAFAILPVQLLVLLNQHRRQKIKLLSCWLISQGIAALPLIPWLLFTHRNIPPDLGVGWISTPKLVALPLTLANLTTGYEVGDTLWFLPVLLFAALGLIFGVVPVRRQNKHVSKHVYLLLLVFLPLLAVFFVSQIHPVYLNRYFIVILPGLLFLMIEGWHKLSKVVLNLGAFIMVVAGMVTMVGNIQDNFYQRANWRAAGNYLLTAVQPDDGVIARYEVESLVYYFGIERYLPLVTTSVTNGLLEGKIQADALPYRRLWIVYPPDDQQIVNWLKQEKVTQTISFDNLGLALIVVAP